MFTTPSSLLQCRHATGCVALLSVLALCTLAIGARAADELPEGAFRITTEELKWKAGRVPGHEIAAIMGDSTKPGPYVERVKFPAPSSRKTFLQSLLRQGINTFAFSLCRNRQFFEIGRAHV